jgi:hypothetical protein
MLYPNVRKMAEKRGVLRLLQIIEEKRQKPKKSQLPKAGIIDYLFL